MPVLAILAMLSPRGTIAVCLIFITDIVLLFYEKKEERTTLLQLILSYIPAGLLVSIWQVMHYYHFGWIGYNPDSNWGELTKILDFKGILRNVVIIIWRTFDFGRISIWLVFLFSAIYLHYKKIKLPSQSYHIFILFIIPFLGFSVIFLPFSNPIAHRYYITTFMLFALLVFYLLTKIPDIFLRYSLYSFMLFLLWSGHFWVYPDKIAKGWDASLAHLPYFKLRKEVIHYLDNQNIPLNSVGSDFPNLSSQALTDLINDNRSFKEKDLANDKYILYSNIFNSFSDTEIIELKTVWHPIETWKCGQVYFTLYRHL